MDWLVNGFGAVRKARDDGHEWFDYGTIAFDRQEAMQKAKTINKQCGVMWANDNPVIRFATIKVSET